MEGGDAWPEESESNKIRAHPAAFFGRVNLGNFQMIVASFIDQPLIAEGILAVNAGVWYWTTAPKEPKETSSGACESASEKNAVHVSVQDSTPALLLPLPQSRPGQSPLTRRSGTRDADGRQWGYEGW